MERQVTLGRTVITNRAKDRLWHDDVLDALSRHARGDWGEVCPKNGEENDVALRYGERLLSVYVDRNGTTFWIITEGDRSATTVLLPDDY